MAPPADTVGLADYVVTVTSAQTNVATTIDTQSTATSYALSGLGGGQYFVTVTPYDANGNAGIVSPAISIYAAAMTPVSWAVSTPTATVGSPLTAQFASANSGYTYSIVSGPAGATINPTTGLLSWVPAAPGATPIIVAATNPNGWGTVQAVLNIGVALSDAPTALAVTPGADPLTGNPTLTATWAPPTLNAAAIVGYHVQIVPTGGAALTIDVQATGPLSLSLSDQGITTGSIQVTAFDAMGNVGIPTAWLTF